MFSENIKQILVIKCVFYIFVLNNKKQFSNNPLNYFHMSYFEYSQLKFKIYIYILTR